MSALHKGYVQKITGGGWFAVCPTCGMDMFPDRRSRADAETDARKHEEQIDRTMEEALLSQDYDTFWRVRYARPA